MVALLLTPAHLVAAAPSGFVLPFDFSAADPQGAFDPSTGTGATPSETVESLVPDDFRCDDSVTFFTSIRVKPATTANQTLDLTFSFLQEPTGRDGAGFAPNLTSAAIVDEAGQPTAAAAAVIVHETVDTSGPHEELKSTVRVSDLDPAETVFLRLDIELVCQAGAYPTGVLQAALESITQHGNTLPVGRQVVPLKVEGLQPNAPGDETPPPGHETLPPGDQTPPPGHETLPPGSETPPPVGGGHPGARGQITVIEKAKGYRDFFFSLFDVAANSEVRFRLDPDPISAPPDRMTFSDLEPGRFQVTQRLVTEGYVLTGIECTGDPDVRIGTDNDFDPGDISATIDLSARENVVCTFTNTKQGDVQPTLLATGQASTTRDPATGTVTSDARVLDLRSTIDEGATAVNAQGFASYAGEQRPGITGMSHPASEPGPRSATGRGGGTGSESSGTVSSAMLEGPMLAGHAGRNSVTTWIALACFLLVASSMALTLYRKRSWVAAGALASLGGAQGDRLPRP
ncbi:MAG TPA: hypothetical protein VII47_11470 [Actinomycetota bacterium]